MLARHWLKEPIRKGPSLGATNIAVGGKKPFQIFEYGDLNQYVHLNVVYKKTNISYETIVHNG